MQGNEKHRGISIKGLRLSLKIEKKGAKLALGFTIKKKKNTHMLPQTFLKGSNLLLSVLFSDFHAASQFFFGFLTEFFTFTLCLTHDFKSFLALFCQLLHALLLKLLSTRRIRKKKSVVGVT